jgi:hypothetical protein
LTSGIRAFLFRFERMLLLSFGRGQGWFDNVDGREHRRALLDCTAEGRLSLRILEYEFFFA